MSYVTVYVTNPSQKEAKRIAQALLKKKLIACANTFPIDSSYLWKGKIASSREYATLMKTSKQNAKKVELEVKKMHKYEVPCIARFKTKANEDYEAWVKRETKQA